jgi:anti-sigma factor RsiW
MMDNQRMTCERVDREDLDTRYLAAQLTEAEAEAFEAHYFECDRCWELVHRGVEVRSAGRPAATVKVLPASPRQWRRWMLVPLAAAAVALLWVATRRTSEPPAGSDTTVRGGAGTDSLLVVVGPAGSNVGATWSGVADAASYQVRLFDASGALLWERRIADTAVSIPRDSIPGISPGSLYWQIQALDLIGAAVARSALIEVPPLPDSTKQ